MAEAEYIRASGYLDETNILVGILQWAAVGNTYANRLLRKVIMNMGMCMDNDFIDYAIEDIQEIVVRSIRQKRCVFPGQQWQISLESDGWRVLPFASCGLFRIVDLEDSGPTLVRLNVPQTNSLFQASKTEALRSLLNGGGTVTDLEALLSEDEVLDATLGQSEAFSLSLICSATKGVTGTSDFIFEKVEYRCPQSEAMADALSGNKSPVKRLLAALEFLRSIYDETFAPGLDQHDNVAPHRLDPGPWRPVLLIGESMTTTADHCEEAPETISLFDLHISVLSRLWKYQQLRHLEYDDF